MTRRLNLGTPNVTASTAFTDLLLLAMQMGEGIKDRQWKSLETEKEREWQTEQTETAQTFASEQAMEAREYDESLVYLKDLLADKNRADEQAFALRGEARQVGVLQTALDKIAASTPEKATSGSGEIVGTRREQLSGDLDDQEAFNNMIEQELNLYHKGYSAANALDVNYSGTLEPNEIKTYADKWYKDGIPTSVEQGLNAWTLDPLKRAGLETQRLAAEVTKQELAEKKERYKFLPAQLQDEATLRSLAIEGGGLDIDLKELSLETVSLQQDQMRQALALGATQLDAADKQLIQLTNQIDRDDWRFDAELRTASIASTEGLIVNNIEAQTGIAAGILSNMTIRKQDDSYLPLFTVLTADVSVRPELIKDINDSRYLTSIKQDLLGLVEAYSVGKGEEQLPDYSFVLDKVSEIAKLKEHYKNWVNLNRAGLDDLAVENGFVNFKDAILGGKARDPIASNKIREFAEDKEYSIYDISRIMEAIAWSQTGIYSDMKSLNKAAVAKDQYRHLHALLEQAKAHDVSEGILKAAPTYTTQETSLILSPFETMPLRTEKDALNIFIQELDTLK